MKPTTAAMVGGSRMTAMMSEKDAFCKYSHRACLQNCLEGFDFCIRHILEDKAAPYKQCAYMTKAGRRCPSAAPKLERKEGFCAAHNRKSLLARQRLARKRRPRETGEGLLEELVALTSAAGTGGPGGTIQHEHRRSKMFTDSVASRALEYASSSDSESELGPAVEQTWRDDGDSDAESIDSDQEDLLKYAGVYTTEEVAQILRDKLIRLQALYIDQFKRLKHMLLVKRRQYLRARGPEREGFGSIKLYKKDPAQRDRYNKLKAMQHYHKKAGKEALLQLQSTQRRIQASAEATAGPLSPARPLTSMSAAAGSSKSSFPACTFLDDGILCSSRVVPLSKFCQKHILHDPCQLLYRPCPFADSQCGRPVPTLLNTEFCSLHQTLPPTIKLEDDKSAEDVAPLESSASEGQDTMDTDTGIDTAAFTNSHEGRADGMVTKSEIKLEIKPEVDSFPSHVESREKKDLVCGPTQSSDGTENTTTIVNDAGVSCNIESESTDLTAGGRSGVGDTEAAQTAGGETVKREEEETQKEEEEEDDSSVIFTLGEEEDDDEEMDKQGR